MYVESEFVSCQRPYHVVNTGSRPITAVKQLWAWSVLGWVTAWEHHVLLALNFKIFHLHSFSTTLNGGKCSIKFSCFIGVIRIVLLL